MKFLHVFFLFCFCFLSTLLGSDYYIDDIYSADVISKGNVEGFSTNSQVLWSNPASLINVDSISLGFYSSTFMDDDVKYNNYSLSFPLKSFTIGLGYYDVRIDDLEKNSLDVFGEAQTDYTYNFVSTISKLAIQHPFSKLGSVGLSVSRYSYSGYDLTGVGYNLDLGGYLSIPIKKRIESLDLSASFKNILPLTVDYSNGNEEDIPTTLVLSGAVHFSNKLDLYLQRSINFDSAQLSGLGITYTPMFYNQKILSLSLGANTYLQLKDSSKTSTIYSAGLGLFLYKMEFHIAYQYDPDAYSEKQYFYTTIVNF